MNFNQFQQVIQQMTAGQAANQAAIQQLNNGIQQIQSGQNIST